MNNPGQMPLDETGPMAKSYESHYQMAIWLLEPDGAWPAGYTQRAKADGKHGMRVPLLSGPGPDRVVIAVERRIGGIRAQTAWVRSQSHDLTYWQVGSKDFDLVSPIRQKTVDFT